MSGRARATGVGLVGLSLGLAGLSVSPPQGQIPFTAGHHLCERSADDPVETAHPGAAIASACHAALDVLHDGINAGRGCDPAVAVEAWSDGSAGAPGCGAMTEAQRAACHDLWERSWWRCYERTAAAYDEAGACDLPALEE